MHVTTPHIKVMDLDKRGLVGQFTCIYHFPNTMDNWMQKKMDGFNQRKAFLLLLWVGILCISL